MVGTQNSPGGNHGGGRTPRAAQRRLLAAVAAAMIAAALAGCAMGGDEEEPSPPVSSPPEPPTLPVPQSPTAPEGPTIVVELINAGAANGRTVSCSLNNGAPVTTVVADGTASARLTGYAGSAYAGKLYPVQVIVLVDRNTVRVGSKFVEADSDTTVTFDYSELESREPTFHEIPDIHLEKVVCAELHRQGLMEESIFRADEAFGSWIRDRDPTVLRGYQFWAKPLVRLMRRSAPVTAAVNAVARPWSRQMAHLMGARDTGDSLGSIIMFSGKLLCRGIGRVIELTGSVDPGASAGPAAEVP